MRIPPFGAPERYVCFFCWKVSLKCSSFHRAYRPIPQPKIYRWESTWIEATAWNFEESFYLKSWHRVTYLEVTTTNRRKSFQMFHTVDICICPIWKCVISWSMSNIGRGYSREKPLEFSPNKALSVTHVCCSSLAELHTQMLPFSHLFVGGKNPPKSWNIKYFEAKKGDGWSRCSFSIGWIWASITFQEQKGE